MPKHLTEEQKLSIRKKRNSEERHLPNYQATYQAEKRRLRAAGVTMTLGEWKSRLTTVDVEELEAIDSDIQELVQERTDLIQEIASRAK